MQICFVKIFLFSDSLCDYKPILILVRINHDGQYTDKHAWVHQYSPLYTASQVLISSSHESAVGQLIQRLVWYKLSMEMFDALSRARTTDPRIMIKSCFNHLHTWCCAPHIRYHEFVYVNSISPS